MLCIMALARYEVGYFVVAAIWGMRTDVLSSLMEFAPPFLLVGLSLLPELNQFYARSSHIFYSTRNILVLLP